MFSMMDFLDRSPLGFVSQGLMNSSRLSGYFCHIWRVASLISPNRLVSSALPSSANFISLYCLQSDSNDDDAEVIEV